MERTGPAVENFSKSIASVTWIIWTSNIYHLGYLNNGLWIIWSSNIDQEVLLNQIIGTSHINVSTLKALNMSKSFGRKNKTVFKMRCVLTLHQLIKTWFWKHTIIILCKSFFKSYFNKINLSAFLGWTILL